MGLIKAAVGATGGVMADQWKEFFCCEALSADILVSKGQKWISGRSSNTKGADSIISNGSVIAVADGQCMIIVDQGKVVEVCAESGQFIYDFSTEPSIFYGGLGQGILDSFKNIGARFTFGGNPGKDQRVYYVNTKEIIGNKYGTASPVPFRVVDHNIGLDIDISIRCNGEYSYKITDPILFYTNVCGNISSEYNREEIDSMLKSELMTALQPAFSKISEMGIRYSALPGHTMELTDALNQVLSNKWSSLRGITVASIGINALNASKEDENLIKEMQRNAALRNPTMAAAQLVGAQAQAMQDAAKNQSAGPVMAFAGINMAQGAGSGVQNLFSMGQEQQASGQKGWQCPCGASNTGRFCVNCGKPQAVEWNCACGASNTGKFCANCGKPQPQADQWECVCGAANSGNFCQNCGKPKPTGFRCDKCGWTPMDGAQPPKFCPQCGDVFDDRDR